MARKANILLVDDDLSLRQVLEYSLSEKGHQVFAVGSGVDALQVLRTQPVDLAIVDLQMEGMSGMELLEKIKERERALVVIIITAYGSIEVAVEAMKKGAYDFITKPFNRDELILIVAKAIEYNRLYAENIRLKQELRDRFNIEGIIGSSRQISDLIKLTGKIANTDSTVLITGDSGTGKELFAKAIHYNSGRKNQPFIAINCAAIPRELLESELFGFEKGSFTGAHKTNKGKFELASTGTVFLDEIGDMPSELQVKILRVLQEKEINRIGASEPIKVDIRIIAATNKNLKEAVEQGEFREDLFYRVSVIPIHIPPLRERREDIPLLLEHILKKFDCPGLKFAPELHDFILNYNWPGNVRELENVVERLIAFCGPDGTATIADVPEFSRDKLRPIDLMNIQIPDDGIILDDVERNIIIAGLNKSDWNQSRAARLLGVSRQTLIYRMQKYDLDQKRPELD